jgi:hypothetical protein
MIDIYFSFDGTSVLLYNISTAHLVCAASYHKGGYRATPARRKHIPKETLQHLYLGQGLSPRKIGQQLGCGETAVRKRLKEYNIPMRSRSQAIRLGKGIVIERETLVELY